MKIEFKKSWKIDSTKEWVERFSNSTKDEDGKSAKSLAEFCNKTNSESFLKQILAPILGEKISFDFIMPEYQTKFDNLGKGRMHDLAIKGDSAKGSFFIGIEAKVNESFGGKICNIYRNSIEKENSNIAIRIKTLLQDYFPNITTDSELPYQLLYSTVASVKEGDIHIMLVLVFETDQSDKRIQKKNKKALVDFLNCIGAELIYQNEDSEYYKTLIGKETLTIIYTKIKN